MNKKPSSARTLVFDSKILPGWVFPKNQFAGKTCIIMTPMKGTHMIKAIKLFVGILALVYLMNFAMLAINTNMLATQVATP